MRRRDRDRGLWSARALAAAVLALHAANVHADPLPVKVLTCAAARIAQIGTRLVDGQTGKPIAGSGSRVTFDNGGTQVSYDDVPAITKTGKVGDHVFICLVYVPKHCPAGDDRGRIYTTTNLRTLESWTLSDSQHQCGGA